MASNPILKSGVEDHNILNSATPNLGEMPSPTASPKDTQESASPLPALPMSELVRDFDTILQPPPFASMHESKHNPDFRVRNQGKWLQISTLLADINSRLQAARQSEDQFAFDSLHAHVLKAGKGPDSSVQSPLVVQADDDPRLKDEDLGKSIVPNRENEWYLVQHDSLEGDAIERDVSATKRLQCARKAYEAMLDEVSSDSESDGGAFILEQQHSEGEDTTLVEDTPEDLEPFYAASSLTLDGSHAQTAPDLMVVSYPNYYHPEMLQRAADFLEMLQNGNKTIMDVYGITLDDLDIAEDETSISEAVEDLPLESVQAIIEEAETLRRCNEAVMAAYGLSISDLDLELNENEEVMHE